MQWHQLDHMQTICTSLQTARKQRQWGFGMQWHHQVATPRTHHSIFTGWMLFPTPNQQRQTTTSNKSRPELQQQNKNCCLHLAILDRNQQYSSGGGSSSSNSCSEQVGRVLLPSTSMPVYQQLVR